MICGRLYFSKVAMAIFLVPHSFPEPPPRPHQEVESFSSPCNPGQAFVTAWTRKRQKKQTMPHDFWGLVSKSQYRVCLALSRDTRSWNPAAILGGRARHMEIICRLFQPTVKVNPQTHEWTTFRWCQPAAELPGAETSSSCQALLKTQIHGQHKRCHSKRLNFGVVCYTVVTGTGSDGSETLRNRQMF